MMKNAGLAIYCVVFLLNSGCVSLMEKAGHSLDRSVPKEKQTSIYRTAKNSNSTANETTKLPMEIRILQNKAGEQSMSITLNQYPTMKLRGSMPNEKGEFFLTSLDYLGGSVHGWNEYRMDIFGSGRLVLGDTTASFSISDEVVAVQITSGRIRRYDTRITGDEALANLRNRRERILALAEWLNSLSDKGPPPDTAKTDIDAFETYWKPILLPEAVMKKKRPKNWQQEGDQFINAEDIRWNSSYTERTFPEELWNIRNSGTMLRDWEEALDWIYNEYAWPRITELLAQETMLDRTKR
jgi:hypothetical protein